MLKRSGFRRPTIERKRTAHTPVPEHLRRNASMVSLDGGFSARIEKEGAVQHAGYMDLVRAMPCAHCGRAPRSQFCHLDGQDLVPNMDGTGFISIQRGRSTSAMTIREMVAVIDLCHAFGADQGVKWSPTSLGRDAFVVDPETGEVVETRAEREGVVCE